jgi:hypothetical protein
VLGLTRDVRSGTRHVGGGLRGPIRAPVRQIDRRNNPGSHPPIGIRSHRDSERRRPHVVPGARGRADCSTPRQVSPHPPAKPRTSGRNIRAPSGPGGPTWRTAARRSADAVVESLVEGRPAVDRAWGLTLPDFRFDGPVGERSPQAPHGERDREYRQMHRSIDECCSAIRPGARWLAGIVAEIQAGSGRCRGGRSCDRRSRGPVGCSSPLNCARSACRTSRRETGRVGVPGSGSRL